MSKQKQCLIEGCPNKMLVRGLCIVHYRMISQLVKQGKRNWQEFIDVGMSEYPTRKGHTKQVIRFRKMAEKKGLEIK